MATYYWVGGSGTWNNVSTANWSAASGGAAGAGPPLAADVVNFDASSGTGTVTVASGAVCTTLTHNAPNITLSLSANFTMAGTATLSAGVLNLNNNTFTSSVFVSTANAARTLDFGTTGKLACTRTAALSVAVDWYNATTALTVLGTPVVDFTGATAAGVTQTFRSQGLTPTNPPSVNIKAGAGNFVLSNGFGYKNIDFTGFTGVYSITGPNIYGNMTLAATMTTAINVTNPIAFVAASGTQTLTTNGVTVDGFITVGAAGTTNTLLLADNLTMAAARTLTLTSGTLNMDGKTVSAGAFASSNSNVRTLAFGTDGALTITNTGTVFNAATSTNLSVTGTGTISMTNAGVKTFAGGGGTYPILNQGGAGALTISGSNTFTNITNSVQPTTITLTSGTTQTVTSFTASGTAGNVVTLNAATPGARATLLDNSGTNSVSYMTITDIAATGSAEWQSYLTNGNTDGGNNVGWVFTPSGPIVAEEYPVDFRSFTEKRRF